MSDEPIVKGSWPLVEMRDGRPLWHVAGTNPPEYAPDTRLEALWRAAQKPRMGKVIQLELWERAA